MSAALDNFFDAWGQSDPDARAALLAKAITDTTAYTDPRSPGTLTGLAAIGEYVAMFSANAPGWTAKVVKRDTSGTLIRATVAFGGKGPDGADMQQLGQYFAETASDGTLARITGFVGTGAPE